VTWSPSYGYFGDICLGQQDRAFRLGTARETDCNLGGVEVSIVANSQGTDYAGRLQKWIEAIGLVGRDFLNIEAHAPATIQVAVENFSILWPSGDFQTTRVDPIERLSRFRCEGLDFSAGIFDQFDHEVALPHATDHARGTRRSLRPNIMLVEEGNG